MIAASARVGAPSQRLLRVALFALCAAVPLRAQAAPRARPPLRSADIDDIARLEMLEDRRLFDSTDLTRIFASKHPEVRRRAAVSIGRIADKRGISLLRATPLDKDTAIAATVVFAIGQMRDTSTIPWFDSLLSNVHTPSTVATEAAIALGKIKTANARAVLANLLSKGVVGTRDTPVIRQALLSIGRSTARGDLAPILRWSESSREEIRWRATWALFRPRDPAAVARLIVLSKDGSPVVRSWAVRGLTRTIADSANLGVEAEARLLRAVRDVDRSVRTEALNSLGTYSDSNAVTAIVAELDSPDAWVSVAAARALGKIRAASSVDALQEATILSRPCALRLESMRALQNISLSAATTVALAVVRDTVPYCRSTAAQALVRVTTGPGADSLPMDLHAAVDTTLRLYRAAVRAETRSRDLTIQTAAVRALASFGDSTDLPPLLDLRAKSDSLSAIGLVSATTIATIQRRAGLAAQNGRGGQAPAGRGRAPRPTGPDRPFEEYRRIVERWVVPDYSGKARPTARIETPHGTFDVELYAGDAPLAVEDFVRTVEAGSMIGTEFTRVEPDFVIQQQSIRGGNTLRDEVNRRGLTRENLAWATAGLDTGTPGYTLGHTPQPHNEGDFTSLGHVIRGMDVVDRVDLGDRIIAAKMLTGGTKK